MLTTIVACVGPLPAAPASSNHAHATPHSTALTDRFEGVTSSDLNSWVAAHAQSEAGRRSSPWRHAFAIKTASIHAAASRVMSASGPTSTLVLYDSSGQWGYLGELYAIATANLATHFGSVTVAPVTSYTAGLMNRFNATYYIGSTYYSPSADPVPKAFYTDAIASTHPLVWMNDNIWNFANAVGVTAFENKYGWDPTTSYFAGPYGTPGNVTQVSYKGQNLARTMPPGTDASILRPNVLGGAFPAVSVVAQAVDTSTSPATVFPWAVRSSNLTYIGEIPFQYVTESDRIIAFEDLFFDALAPSTPSRHQAMVRLEDLTANDDPAQLQAIAQWLYTNNVPYSFNVIPYYADPSGYYNNGVPQMVSLAQAPQFVNAIKFMLSHGGTMVDEGFTHQYGSQKNPYDAVSGDDAEFFMSHVDPVSNRVVWDGPVPNDSVLWAEARVLAAKYQFASVGLPVPQLWVTPHYYASDTDYRVFAFNYAARYERSLYFSGLLSGHVNHAQFIGEFFPYIVRDIYGSAILPENLGDYEPVSLNGNPVRLPQDIINEAQLNLAVRDGYASFFYDPSYGLPQLTTIVNGIRSAGYTFVSPLNASSKR